MFRLNSSTCWSNWEDLLHHICLWESSLASARGSVLLVAAYHQLNSYTTSEDIDVSTLSSSITLLVLVQLIPNLVLQWFPNLGSLNRTNWLWRKAIVVYEFSSSLRISNESCFLFALVTVHPMTRFLPDPKL